MSEKKSFIIHLDSLSVLNELTDEQAGALFKAIYQYHLGNEPLLDFGLKMAFLPFRNQFKRDAAKYQSIIERNRMNGSKGGRPEKENPNNPVGLLATQITQDNPSKPKKADSDSDSDNDSVNESKNKYKTHSFFSFADFKFMWDEFEKLKKRKKASTNERILENQFKKLLKISKENYDVALSVLTKSVNSGWTDFYEPKEDKPKGQDNHPPAPIIKKFVALD